MATIPASTGTGWDLTSEAFEHLLRRLSADQRRAGAEYESLRRRLIFYFQGRGWCDADVCADETLDRVARKLHQGERIESVARYARGVARLVALEALRRLQQERRALDEWRRTPKVEGTDETVLTLLEAQLQNLPPNASQLLVEYYLNDELGVRRRRSLAARLGISYGALRTRMHRVRTDLEACLRDVQ